MSLRVIQWATGGVGRAAIQAIVSHPELELVGCWVHDPAKVGRDAGELAGLPPPRRPATNDEARSSPWPRTAWSTPRSWPTRSR
jgi:2,4-diaminopentanoate dehydrogenase